MRKISRITEDEKIAICCDYMDMAVSTVEITQKYGISFGSLMRIVDSNGIARRGNAAKGKRYQRDREEVVTSSVPVIDGRNTKAFPQNTIDAFYDGELKTLPKKETTVIRKSVADILDNKNICDCGCKYNPSNAKYCCACGKQLRTEKELIILQIDALGEYISYAPQGTRDQFRDAILNIVKNINEKLKGCDE